MQTSHFGMLLQKFTVLCLCIPGWDRLQVMDLALCSSATPDTVLQHIGTCHAWHVIFEQGSLLDFALIVFMCITLNCQY